MTNAYPLPRSSRETDWLVGDGRRKYGPFDFRIFDTQDVQVRLRSTGASDFTVIDLVVEKVTAAAFTDFTVQFPFDVTDQMEFQVRGYRIQERLSDLFRGGSIKSDEVEKVSSQEGVVLQELRRDISEVSDLFLSTAVRVPRQFIGSPILPMPVPGNLIGWNDNGNGFSNKDVIGSGSLIVGEAGRVVVSKDTVSGIREYLGIRDVLDFDDLPSVRLTDIPADVKHIRSAGFVKAGDGGDALYVRVANEPSHEGKVKSLDGAWWELTSWPISVRMFGATGDGETDDTAAFLAAIHFYKTGNERQGGRINIPSGHYMVRQTLSFDGIDDVTNFWLQGDGILNTTLDFNGAEPNTDGIFFNGGSQVGLRDFMIDNAPGRGVVLNDSFSSFVSFVDLRGLRVQNSGSHGIYSKNSYLVSMDDIYCSSNGGAGFNFVGNHTSILARKTYARNNVDAGFAINGAAYIDINAQSDGNKRGYAISNVRGGVLHAPGSEGNKIEGILLTSGDSGAENIFPEYQNIEGLVIIGAFSLRNNEAGPTGNNANTVAAITANNRPISFTMIGCVDDIIAGDPSVVLNGASGKVTMTEIDCRFKGNLVKAGSVERRNMSVAGKKALVEKAANQSIANASAVTVTWDALVTSNNDLGATLSSNAFVVPPGVSKLRASAGVTWTSSGAGARYLAIYLNGNAKRGLPQDRRAGYSGSTLIMSVSSGTIDVSAGDTLTVVVIQDSGNPLNIEGGIGCWFEIEAVS